MREILKFAFKIKEKDGRKEDKLTTDYLFRSFMESNRFSGFFQEIEERTGITIREIEEKIKKSEIGGISWKFKDQRNSKNKPLSKRDSHS